MSGARSRRKGASYERELVHRFREAMPGADVKRGFQTRSGQEAADVECPVFWVEKYGYYGTAQWAPIQQIITLLREVAA